jgi:hypothetical protein
MIPNEDNGKINANKILIILLLAGFMSMLNETALNIAFPQIMIEQCNGSPQSMFLFLGSCFW